MARHLGGLLLFGVLCVGMTWPQAQSLSTRVHDSDDPLLSIWRLSWIAHVLPRSPDDLLNGNIFYPEKRTLAYTDAVLLQGMAAAPFIWAGFSPVAVYNVLLLVLIALSGWAMYFYAWRLTGNTGGSVIAGIIFAFVPYRFDHYHHLELQAAMFMPLTLLALEHALERRTREAAALVVAAFVGQVYSGIYYAIFLGTALLVIIPVRLRLLDRDARVALLRAAGPPIVVGVMLVAPYLLAYMGNRGTLGERNDREVQLYSATILNYLAATPDNLTHGSWSADYGQNERRLFPGLLATALALAGALGQRGPKKVTLLIAGAVGLFISFGLNNPLYEPMRDVLFAYRGLRAPARASILAFLAIAGLAAVSYARLDRRLPRFTKPLVATALALGLLFEYQTRMDFWLTLPVTPPQVYRWLAAQPRSVVFEVPVVRSDELYRIPDGQYMYYATYHWQPILNGYSGFVPRSYMELLDRAESFPDEGSIEYLKQRGVDIIVVHGGLLNPADYGAITSALLARRDLQAVAQFDENRGSDMVFRLLR